MNPLTYRIERQDNTVTIERSDGETLRGSDYSVMDLLLLDPSERYNQLVWDLDQFVSPILRMLDNDSLAKLQQEQKVFVKPYKLFYIPSKIFGVTKGRLEGNLYDLQQYFPEEQSPDTIEGIQTKADELVKALRQLKISPKAFTSPAKILMSCHLKNLSLPTITDIPDEVGKWAYFCSGKNWIEAHQLGRWEIPPPYHYDLSSAFPSIASKLLDLRGFRWQKSKDMLPDAKYGYLKGTVRIDADISPIIYRSGDGELYSPTGEWEDYITLAEVKFIEHWKIGSFTLDEGWFGFVEEEVYPLQALMEKLYHQRDIGGLASNLSKRMGASYYGLTGQQQMDGTFGEYFNPVYNAEITARARLMVGHFIYKNNIKPIAITTDGVLTLDRVEVPDKKGMGVWRLESQEPALVIASGLNLQGQKHPQNFYYDDLVEEMRKHPKNRDYEKLESQFVTLGHTVNVGLDKLGERQDMINSISIDIERDRDFGKGPRCGGDLLDKVWESKPWPVKILQ